MSHCLKEQTTQHYKGEGHGYGPLPHDETVVFAVFEKTVINGEKLHIDAFPSKQLKRGEVSLARNKHLTAKRFHKDVVEILEPTLGKFKGIAVASVEAIRAIPFRQIPVEGLGLCVLDTVTKHDYQAHAAIEYSEAVASLTEKQKGVVGQYIRADLADIFGKIKTSTNDFFQNPSRVQKIKEFVQRIFGMAFTRCKKLFNA